jgi:hypothetical protein
MAGGTLIPVAVVLRGVLAPRVLSLDPLVIIDRAHDAGSSRVTSGTDIMNVRIKKP